MKKKTIFLISQIGLVVVAASTFAIVDAVIKHNSSVVYHTVSFDTNGGSKIADVKVKHGEKLNKPNEKTGSLQVGTT